MARCQLFNLSTCAVHNRAWSNDEKGYPGEAGSKLTVNPLVASPYTTS
jgi:hypothetical protein